ncbi:MAG: L,D-transpeptidase [Ilumatobacteraceae bacterium]
MKRRIAALVVACAAIGSVAPGANAARVPTDDASTTTVVPVPSSYTAPDAPPSVVPEVRPLNERITYTRAVPPRLPHRSGAGRRIVYSNRLQWVWVIDKNDEIIRQMPVSGRRGVPEVGRYAVTTKSPWSFSLDFDNVTFKWMTRFAFGPGGGNVGFHDIPLEKGKPMQTEGELGRFKGSGCVRMTTEDARFIYRWATPGTTVVVTP